MKGAALALLCAVALVSAELNENGCPINPYDDVLIPHPNCNKFYQCLQGDLFERNCASTLVFNVETQECDWPENVDCENRTPVVPESSEESEESATGSGNDDPSLAPEICAAEDSDGILVAHEQCNKFYQCHNGAPVTFQCAPGSLVFNPSTDACDWPENVDCGSRTVGGDGDSGNEDGDSDNGDADSGNGDGDNENEGNSEENNSAGGDSGNGDGDNEDNVGGGNGNPSEAPEICAAEESDGVLVAHENCNQFYVCNHGKPVALVCPSPLLFNPNNDRCDWADKVDCEGRNPDSGNGDENDNESVVGGGHDDPSLAPEICAAENSDGTLIAHENCNQFYQCSGGLPVALPCPADLLFNPAIDQCDWPENVNCVRNPDSGNGDEDDNGNNVGGGHDDPSLAPEICAAEDSDGVLVAHENCNQFYKCSAGLPVALPCPADLTFNPFTDQCDWSENVNCVRAPETDSGNGDSGNEEEGNSESEDGNGDEDNVDSENGNSDENGNGDENNSEDENGNGDENNSEDENGNGDENNSEDDNGNGDEDNGEDENGNGDEDNENENVGGGHSDPSLAPEICAADDSDSVLVAHENCNQFYICSDGAPLAQSCPAILYFNPATDKCDWPESVDCGERNTLSSFNKHIRRILEQLRSQ